MRTKWGSNAVWQWFYHRCPLEEGLRWTGRGMEYILMPSITLGNRDEESHAKLCAIVGKMNTRDLVEEFCT